MPAVLQPPGFLLLTALGAIGLGACGEGASGQARAVASKSSQPPSACPAVDAVGTAAGFPVTLKTAGGSPDSFLCAYEMTDRYRGTYIELTGEPASLAGDVFDKVKQSAKVMNGDNAKAERIDVGSEGWAYGGDGGSEAAATDGGHVYHATLHSGPLSTVGDQKDAMVRVVKLMVGAAPAGQRASGQNVCALATSAEFQQASEDRHIAGDIPIDPMATDMSWGPHCDYSSGSIDLFQTKPQDQELERVLGLVEAGKQPRQPVPGLGQRAFFTIIYPNDENRRRGFLAVYTGPRIVAFSMDAEGNEPIEATRPKLERLAKLVLPRLE